MRNLRNLALCVSALIWLPAAQAQNSAGSVSLEIIAQRLDQLEKQNADLREEIRVLRANMESIKPSSAATEAVAPAADRVDDLEEQVRIQAGRLIEQDQIKVQGTQRAPLRLTGMVLFNAFANGRYGGTMDYPPTAARTPDRARSGATLAQSVFGLEFQSPDAVFGGRFKGSFLMDLSSGDGTPLNTQLRLRTASIEGEWKTRSILVGQETPIFSPRQPNSLARLSTSPLTSAGNLWMWRQQVRFEQRLKLGSAQELRAQVGVAQTREDLGAIPAQFTAEPRRPAFESNLRITHRFDEFRRIEIGHGFHTSKTHVAGSSVPATVSQVDWFVNPARRLEFTGAAFNGKNLAKHGGTNSLPSFVILSSRPGETRVVPVHGKGGWAQLTWIATPRLSFNAFNGQHHTGDRDLLAQSIRFKNIATGANFFYRVAPNVVTGIEAAQVRSWYIDGLKRRNNHYDLYVAYLF